SYGNIVLNVAEFRRTNLDLRGWLKYMEIYHDRACRHSDIDTVAPIIYPVDESLMGAFTHEIAVAQQLDQMGIPVWLMRPSCDIAPDT
ncbi:hypothetical protein DFP72DRAFT_771651, partial [Ephemerocybe angulata]